MLFLLNGIKYRSFSTVLQYLMVHYSYGRGTANINKL